MSAFLGAFSDIPMGTKILLSLLLLFLLIRAAKAEKAVLVVLVLAVQQHHRLAEHHDCAAITYSCRNYYIS